MKKKILLIGSIALSFLTLAACSKPEPTPEPPKPVDAENKGEWGVKEVEKNIEANEKREKEIHGEALEKEYVNYKLASNVEFDEKDIVSSNYASRGLLIVRNEYNRVGFYSLLHNKFLIERMYDEKVLDYTVIANDSVNAIGYVLVITYDDEKAWLDAFGNVLFLVTKDEKINEYNVYISSTVINKRAYATVSVNHATKGNSKTIYEYQDDGTLEDVPALPAQKNENKNTSPFDKGSQYVDIEKYDLKEFGLGGYYISRKGSLYTVFKTDNSVVSTFVIPAGAVMTLAGSHIIYQVSYALDEYATNYTYYSGNNKYEMHSYRVDLMSGEKEELNLGYVISGTVGPYMDKDGSYKYALIGKRTITSAKALTGNELALVDGTGLIVSNLNGYSPENFVKVGTNYYNTVTQILYDASLKEISYLGGMNPKLIKDYKCFKGQLKGLYGLVDYTGKVIVAFDYDGLYTDNEVEGFIFGIKAGHLYRINMADGTETDLGNHYYTLDNYLYIVQDDEGAYSFEFAKAKLGEKVATLSYDRQIGSALSNDFLKYLFFKFVDQRSVEEEVEGEDGQLETADVIHSYSRYVAVSVNEIANYENFETLGEQVEEKEVLGETKKDAQTLKLGNNKMYFTSNDHSSNFFKFTPTETGYYTLEKEYKGYDVNIVSLSYFDEINSTENDPRYINANNQYQTEEYGYVAFLESGIEYFFEVRTSYNNRCTIYIDFTQELGEHQKYPFIHNLDGEKELNFYDEGTYVMLYAPANGYYSFENPDNIEYEVLSDYSFNNAYTVPTEEVDDVTYFKLNEFSYYLLRFNKPLNAEKETFKFNVEYVNDEKLNPVGNSQLNPYVLSIGDNIVSIGDLKYYTYLNDTDSDQYIKISSYNIYVNSMKYVFDKYVNGGKLSSVYNGDAIKVKAGQLLVLRLANQQALENVDYMLRLEVVEKAEIIPTTARGYTEYTNGANTYYLQLQSNNNGAFYAFMITSNVEADIELYNLYGDLYCKLRKEADDREFSVNMYLEGHAVYKFKVASAGYYQLDVKPWDETDQTDHRAQALNETKYNRLYIPYGTTYLVFEPKEDGEYVLFDNTATYNTLKIREAKDYMFNLTTIYPVNGFYSLELKGNKQYIFEINSGSYNNVRIVSLEKDLGQREANPVELTEGKAFDAKANFLDKGMKYDLYAEFTPLDEGTFDLTGFEEYKVSNDYVDVPEDGKVQLQKGNRVLLHAVVTEENYTLLVEFDATDVEDGSNYYKPIEATLTDEGALNLPLVENMDPVWYSFINQANETVFFKNEATNQATLPQGIGYHLMRNGKVRNTDYVALLPGESLMFEVTGTSTEENAMVVFTPTKESDYYTFVNYGFILPMTVEGQETDEIEREVLLPERTFVKLTFTKTSEAEDDTLSVIIKKPNENLALQLITFDAETKKGEYYVTLPGEVLYKFMAKGKGSYNVEFDFNPIEVKFEDEAKFEGNNGVYTSLNKDEGTEGKLFIYVLADNADLTFDYKFGGGNLDRMVITKNTTAYRTMYGPEYEGTMTLINLAKDTVIEISYVRGTEEAEGDNDLVISNITWEFSTAA